MAAITDLASASSVAAGDYLVVSQSGTDKKVTADKLVIAGTTTTSALALQVADTGVGTTTSVLTLGRTGASPSATQRGVLLGFQDANNTTYTAGIVALRVNSSVDYKGALAFNINQAGANSLTTRMSIASDGVITLSGYGAGTLATNSSGVVSASDGRYKTKTRAPIDALRAILQLRPTYYRWKKDSPFASEYEELGFVAQEVAAVIPEASPEPEGEAFKNYSDRAIIAMLVAAVQELTARVAQLEAAA